MPATAVRDLRERLARLGAPARPRPQHDGALPRGFEAVPTPYGDAMLREDVIPLPPLDPNPGAIAYLDTETTGLNGGAGMSDYAANKEAIRGLSMEGRLTVCNMSIEGGARAGMVAPDDKTVAYLKGRPKSPKGAAWDQAVRNWHTLRTDEGAHFDRTVTLDASNLPPIVSWGTSPEQVATIDGMTPDPAGIADEARRAAVVRPRAARLRNRRRAPIQTVRSPPASAKT